MEYPERNDLASFSVFLQKKDSKLYERLSPLGCKTESGEILIYSLATEGVHFTAEDWSMFVKYRKEFRESLK